MKIRTLIISILAVLVVSSTSLAQNAGAPEQEPQEQAFLESTSPPLPQPEPSFVAQAAPIPTPQAPRSARRSAKPPVLSTAADANSPTEVKIFQLKHTMAEGMARLIESVFSIKVHQDPRMNRLIVNTTQEQMESIESLIAATDVEAPEASTSQDIQNLVYRVYMFEIPSGDQDMKPFSMSLETTGQVPPQQLLDAAADKDVQISDFRQIDRGPLSDILIQGRVASYESLRRMVDKLPESNIDELKWGDDDETFTDKIEAAQYTQLPEQMQKHIGKLLGDDIRTVGYWFGNLSVPGGLVAPIGPWTLTLRLDTESDRMLELSVDVGMSGGIRGLNRQPGRQRNDEILSNTIRAKIGKPIIIGYNRESYGTRKMGAMVIFPEVDMIQ